MPHPAPAAAALAGLVRRVDPADAGAQNNLGVVLLARGQRDEAAAAFARALALDPRMTLARRNLDAAGGAEIRARRCDELRARLRADATDADARRELAQHLAAMGRLDDARAELDRLCAQRPNDPGPRVHRALCAQAAGDLDEAALWLERAVALDPRGALPRLHLAEVLYHRGEPAAALAAVDEALALAPDYAEGHHLRAFVLGELGHPDAAHASERARELSPSLARAERNLAASRTATSAPARAIPEPPPRLTAAEGHLALGAAFRQKGYVDEAVREYRRALARGEDEAFVVRALGELHLLRGRPGDAAPHWARATVLMPDDPGAWHGRAVAAHLAGAMDEAERHYREAVRVAGASGAVAARARNDLGVLRASLGDLPGAARAFAGAAAADPALGVAHLNRAAAFFGLGQPDRALEEYRARLMREPNDPDAWAGVGSVLAAGGRHADAKTAFARALDVDPSRDDVRYELAFVAAALGEHGAALRETERAMAGAPLVAKRGYTLAFDFGAGAGDDATTRAFAAAVQRAEPAAVPGFRLGDEAVEALLGELFAAPDVAEPAPADANGAPYALAEECLQAGLYERAAAEASRALARGGERAHGLTLLADVFAAQGYFGEALERYEEARLAGDASLRARVGELRMLRETGRRAAARIAAESLATDHPWDAESLALGALVRADDAPADELRAGETEAALDHARAAAERGGAGADVWMLLAAGWRAIGHAAGEIHALRRALALAPEDARAGLALARALAGTGRTDESAAELERLVARDATAADARVELSALRARAGDVSAARELLVAVLAIDPLHHDALAALGALLADAGRTGDARVAVERVLRADGEHALALAVQGDLLDADGLTLEAWRRWERAIALEPFGDGAARARRAMARAGS